MGGLKFKWAECAYCGQGANARDHVVPVCWNSAAANRKGVDHSENQVIPVCNECNSILGGQAIFSIAERADYLATRLAVKYRKVLSAPVWTDEDLDQLSGMLKKHIKAKQSERLLVLDRIRRCVFAARLPSLKIEDIWAAHHKGKTLAEYLQDSQLTQERAEGEIAREFTFKKSNNETNEEYHARFTSALSEMVESGRVLTRTAICRKIGAPDYWINTSKDRKKMYYVACEKAEERRTEINTARELENV